MYRKPDWEARLAAYLEPLRLRAFAWGQHDCCTFSAGAVEAMTGVDPMPEFRGRYSTAIGSARALSRFGRGTLDATLDAAATSSCRADCSGSVGARCSSPSAARVSVKGSCESIAELGSSRLRGAYNMGADRWLKH
jgi:hypothetical protein